ncbi:crotonase/enoyl-CoA hydratase family protein [Ottowia sp.]|uniref:crotonase/enoyl-CoA hydratase family protein n=1 Tax=Ottowia sp. TaxID=1898956 RepID=UPI003A8A0768
MSQNVLATRHGTITLITVNRPDVRNAVDAATARALYQAFMEFEVDEGARVAVFHGANGHFCAGWDLKSGAVLADDAPREVPCLLAELDYPADVAKSAGPVAGPMGPSRLQLSKPVIAAIEGAAVAGGMELALWCDLRVMAEDAYFGVYCRRFGVPLIDGGTVRLPRLIGQSRALDLILTGRQVKAEEALSIGLANRVTPSGQALAGALALAEQMAAFPQATMRADRLSVLTQWDWPWREAMQREWSSGRECLGDALAGAARFAAGQGRHGSF